MYKKMDIEKVKEAKKKAEELIEDMLIAFEEKTQTKIKDINRISLSSSLSQS